METFQKLDEEVERLSAYTIPGGWFYLLQDDRPLHRLLEGATVRNIEWKIARWYNPRTKHPH